METMIGKPLGPPAKGTPVLEHPWPEAGSGDKRPLRGIVKSGMTARAGKRTTS